MLDQVPQRGVREPVLIGPLRVPEDPEQEVGVGPFDVVNSPLDGLPHVRGLVAHILPVRPFGDLKPVVLRECGVFRIAPGLLQGLGELLVIHVAEAFEEEQGEDILLVVPRVDIAPEQRGCAPEIAFQLLLGNTRHGVSGIPCKAYKRKKWGFSAWVRPASPSGSTS